VRRPVSLPALGDREGIVVHPAVDTGFPMIVLEGALAEWIRWRERVQGVSFEVRREPPAPRGAS
jgi:hypothetical protein